MDSTNAIKALQTSSHASPSNAESKEPASALPPHASFTRCSCCLNARLKIQSSLENLSWFPWSEHRPLPLGSRSSSLKPQDKHAE